jgi:hypothetical protein
VKVPTTLAVDEAAAQIVGNRCERSERTGIGQCVIDQHFVPGVTDQVANERRANEAGPAGNEDAHEPTLAYEN